MHDRPVRMRLPSRALACASLLAIALLAAAPAALGQDKPGCVIKGNISASGEKIYHVPGGAFYDKTHIDPKKGERMFCSEAEARAAGWRRSKR